MRNHRFNVGDRVVVVHEEADYYPTLNMTGTVVVVKDGIDMVGVKHDQRFTGGHDLDGILVGEDAQKGLWYFDPNYQLKRLQHEFVRGDRVMIVEHPHSDLIGSYGTVVYAVSTDGGEQAILVNHDMEHPVLHDGNSALKDKHTPPHHGWWYFGDHSLRYVPRMMLMPDDDLMNDVL